MNIEKIVDKAKLGVIAAMEVVHNAQGRPASEIKIKEDETIVTATDRLAAEAAEPLLDFEGIPLNVEDGSHGDQTGYRHTQDLDSLDGTSVFAGGLMSSTIIWGLYENRKVRAAIVGEPVSGRIWFTTDKSPTQLLWNGNAHPVHVINERLSKKTTVLIDVSHGFTRSGRVILTDSMNAELYGCLNPVTKIIMPGSNGLMHALVANGGSGIAGSITTALGGPWDALGVILVLKAGGHAKAFSITNLTIEECDPLYPDKYDILVCGNTIETVNTLSETLFRVYRGTVPSLVKENITTCICKSPNWAGWAEETGRASEYESRCQMCDWNVVLLIDYKKRSCRRCGGIQIEITRPSYPYCEQCSRSGA